MVPPCSDRISRVPPYSRIVRHLRIRGYHPLWPDFPDRSAYLRTTTGLFRFRSPLLAESLLMSFPPGTEMFQFPGFASYTLCIQTDDTPKGWVAPFGYPRIKACSRLPVAFRSVPRPSSPPGAKASTECPYLDRFRSTDLSSPCTGTITPSAHQDSHETTLTDSSQPSLISTSARSAHNTPLNLAVDCWLPPSAQSHYPVRHARQRTRTHHYFTMTTEQHAEHTSRTHQNLFTLTIKAAATQHDPALAATLSGANTAIVLRHEPHRIDRSMVETIGIEPTTPCLQSRCSPS